MFFRTSKCRHSCLPRRSSERELDFATNILATRDGVYPVRPIRRPPSQGRMRIRNRTRTRTSCTTGEARAAAVASATRPRTTAKVSFAYTRNTAVDLSIRNYSCSTKSLRRLFMCAYMRKGKREYVCVCHVHVVSCCFSRHACAHTLSPPLSLSLLRPMRCLRMSQR